MQIMLGAFTVEVTRKRIRNIHLSVHSPDGRVTISAPMRTGMRAIRAFAVSKLSWIKTQQEKMKQEACVTRRDFTDGECQEVWGRLCPLRVIEAEGADEGVELVGGQLMMRVPFGAERARRMALLYAWYGAEVRREAGGLVRKWERLMGVKIARVSVRPMKTRWGSCSIKARTIRINSELAKKPPACLEYIVVHELGHLRVPSHNARFAALMDKYMPEWRTLRQELNRVPPCVESR
ncbi:MAG: SprT family zinc-dependent metalloprotease [Kiritimatiellae bacterium]|nr:SprT family zinc-dependent metalloprotease [Kiritimatiellia bacterium]